MGLGVALLQGQWPEPLLLAKLNSHDSDARVAGRAAACVCVKWWQWPQYRLRGGLFLAATLGVLRELNVLRCALGLLLCASPFGIYGSMDYGA